jgi:hypothetical protein
MVGVLRGGVERLECIWLSGMLGRRAPDGFLSLGVAERWRGALRLENGVSLAGVWRVLRLDWSRGAGDFGTVLMYADLPQVRAWRAGAQLDIAAVFAVWKSESALSVLFSELSTRQEARTMPASGLCVPCVFTDD